VDPSAFTLFSKAIQMKRFLGIPDEKVKNSGEFHAIQMKRSRIPWNSR
jgi:hypothetical protein